ncbi:MAG: hypothetical protein JNM47_05465 [Hyphomonadaceae bacterium]|nr:hypothetical protein [Hyphomonadaceae bacterium]
MNGPRASLLTRLTLIPLGLLAGVNVWLVVGFWSSLGGGDPLPFQIFGGCIAAIEITFLVVSADAKARGEVTKARIWRAVFAFVLFANVIADFGAIAAKTSADAETRARAVAAYDGAVQIEAEASADIERLTATLEVQGLNLPASALVARLRGLEERRARFDAIGRLPPRSLIEQIATLDAAQAVAVTIAERTNVRDEARGQLREAGGRPEAANAQIEGLVGLAATIGLDLVPETVRVVLAAALAIVCKLVLVFGFWAVTPRLANGVQRHAEVRLPVEGKATEDMPVDREPAARAVAPRRPKLPAKPDPTFERAIDDLENGVV